jgi:hypothetical protein
VAARAKYRAVRSNKFLRLSTVPRTGAVRGSASKRSLVMMINEKGLSALIRDKACEIGTVCNYEDIKISQTRRGKWRNDGFV